MFQNVKWKLDGASGFGLICWVKDEKLEVFNETLPVMWMNIEHDIFALLSEVT